MLFLSTVLWQTFSYQETKIVLYLISNLLHSPKIDIAALVQCVRLHYGIKLSFLYHILGRHQQWVYIFKSIEF